MSKTEWDNTKTMTEIPMHVWYEYYKENGGKLDSIAQFEQVFTKVIIGGGIINGKVTNFVSALNRLYRFYDNKFS